MALVKSSDTPARQHRGPARLLWIDRTVTGKVSWSNTRGALASIVVNVDNGYTVPAFISDQTRKH